MYKLCTFDGHTEYGQQVFPLFRTKTEKMLSKMASSSEMLSSTESFISGIVPEKDVIYVLVNALGACEFYGTNRNADAFPEKALTHTPREWKGIPSWDIPRSKGWLYGCPTFYDAKPFAHHRNGNPDRGFGQVIFVDWNPYMKRVELVAKVDRAKCLEFGGVATWQKLDACEYIDVSMGAKVPFDFAACCGDQEMYERAWRTYDPSVHKSPAEAILAFHRKTPIRGLAITRREYCRCMLERPRHIYPDGKQVFVYNDFPKFFDISFVFVGADRTAKSMWIKKASVYVKLAADEADDVYSPVEEDPSVKTAQQKELRRLEEKYGHLGKISALGKKSSITKEVSPVLPDVTNAVGLARQIGVSDPDLPNAVLDRIQAVGMDTGLSTLTGMGVILKPHEFEHCFPSPMECPALSPSLFSSMLAKLLLPYLLGRSLLAPLLEERRQTIHVIALPMSSVTENGTSKMASASQHAYAAYRQGVLEFLPHLVQLDEAVKLAAPHLGEPSFSKLVSPLSAAYAKYALAEDCVT